jgi:hypothetical protein
MKTLIFMGAAAAAVALAAPLANAVDGIHVEISTGTLHRLELPFRSESYRDAYTKLHDGRYRLTDKDRQVFRNGVTSGLVTPESICRIGIRDLDLKKRLRLFSAA